MILVLLDAQFAGNSDSHTYRFHKNTYVEIFGYLYCITYVTRYDKIDNKHMGGVDFNNHLHGSYHVRWKCMNYKYVLSLFDISITNAFILHSYDVKSSPPMDKKHLHVMLAKQLICLGNVLVVRESVPVHMAAVAASLQSIS